MSVKMFDCGFGDSFLLHYSDKYNPLLVDFGVHVHSKSGGKVAAYENVVKTMNTIEKKDFLLTHFHADHFSGMLYWKKYWYKKYKNYIFDNIVIPGINDIDIIRNLLLVSLRCCHDKIQFIDFLDWYCRSGLKGLRLVSRGDKYNDLEILWPDKNVIREKARKNNSLSKIQDNYNETNDERFSVDKINPLLSYSERILELINSLTDTSYKDYRNAINLIVEVKEERRKKKN